MTCKYHTDSNGDQQFYVTPFDSPLVVKCPCPGSCSGYLVSDGRNSNNTLTFLICSVCKCTYQAPDSQKQ